MILDLQSMDPNQVINNLDELLAQGNAINDIVSALDGVHIIANYYLLNQKGATNIDLIKIRDTVDPIVVMNNLAVFKNAKVPIDIVKIIYGVLDDDEFSDSPYDIEEWTALGADPQVLADKYTQSDGVELGVVQALLNAGAQVDVDKIIDNLLQDSYYLRDDFDAENGVPILQRAGASSESIKKLLKRIADITVKAELATYGGPYPSKLDINEDGRQTTKIFFKPQIQVITPSGGRELRVDWAGRILTGQTLEEGIAAELKDVYDYSGRLEWRDPYFLDWAKDNQGNAIQRYGIYITLYLTDSDKLPL